MKKGVKRIVTGVAVGATVCTSMMVGAIAASKQEKIEAYMDYGITLKLNGQVKNLTNSSGQPTYPIRYKGTTYVPLRAVSELVGLPVNWDGATETVLLGNDGSNAKIDLTTQEATKATEFSWVLRNVSDLIVPGDDANMYFDSGVVFDIWNGSGSTSKNRVMYFSVNGKDTLEFSAWSNVKATVFVYDENGNVYDKFSVAANSLVERTLDVSGISKVGFGANTVSGGSGTLKILDPVIYNK